MSTVNDAKSVVVILKAMESMTNATENCITFAPKTSDDFTWLNITKGKG